MTLAIKARVTDFLKEYLDICLRYSLCITPREPNDLLALNELTGLNANDNYAFDDGEIEELIASTVIFQEISE